MLQQPFEQRFICRTGFRERPAEIMRPAAVPFNPFIDRAIGWPRVEGDQRTIRQFGRDVCDSAEVQHTSRAIAEALHQGRMVSGRKRRTLPARRHICRAEITGQRHTQCGPNRRGINQLQRCAGLSRQWPPVQHSLAMHASEDRRRAGPV